MFSNVKKINLKLYLHKIIFNIFDLDRKGTSDDVIRFEINKKNNDTDIK